ncbi:hypothetical protein A5624_10310 [Mycobacterium sp. 1482292.6]|nr:hypothetical protein A5624_10310 [Mycobacterium sp. 1482292.6]OBJ13323.1 hypothetical protein A5622_06310 [Mycobacterium sp. 1245801.1]
MRSPAKRVPRRLPGRPRAQESPASLEQIFEVSLRAFATLGFDGVALRTLNRELGGSHNLLNGRFGSKEALWYATVDWAFGPLAQRMLTAFDPTLSDPLEQVRIFVRVFLTYSADHPELLGLMNIEGRQDTERLTYIYSKYIEPAMRPCERLLEHLAAEGRIRKVPPRTFHLLLTHGAGAPFTLAPLARHFSPVDPLDPKEVRAHSELCADFFVGGLQAGSAEAKKPPRKRTVRQRN